MIEDPALDAAAEAAALPAVLVVDDEPVIRELVRSVLSRDGRIRVVTASDGEEAVELARAHRPHSCCWTCACRA